jgi:hypothetical protein
VNNCESFFGLLKRGVIGAFHHVSKEFAQLAVAAYAGGDSPK